MENTAKSYKLLGSDGKFYKSDILGLVGGHKKLKIYGRLDCPSALRYIAKGKYVKHRVFFFKMKKQPFLLDIARVEYVCKKHINYGSKITEGSISIEGIAFAVV